MPFAINESTKYISPTKTPEYLAAGKPFVSTRITNVVHPYGEAGLVCIADNADEFIKAVSKELANTDDKWLEEVDDFLAGMSWDEIWKDMNTLIEEAFDKKAVSQKTN